MIPQALTNALLDLQDARVAANAMSVTGRQKAALWHMSAAIQRILEVAETVRQSEEGVTGASTPAPVAVGEEPVAGSAEAPTATALPCPNVSCRACGWVHAADSPCAPVGTGARDNTSLRQYTEARLALLRDGP